MGNFAKVGQVSNLAIAAGTSQQLNIDGTNCYLLLATSPVNMRARDKVSVQAYSSYTQGTGFEASEFTSVDIQNLNTFDVVVSVWIGRSAFIDKRLILANQETPNVANPTYPDPGSAPATNVDIDDLSGQPFTDIDGNKWLALYRVMILISNLDSGVVLLVQKSGGTGASPAILAVQPLTDRAIPVSGNYTVNNGGGNLNCIVSEIYAAIPAT
jgi:hypothetical protein